MPRVRPSSARDLDQATEHTREALVVHCKTGHRLGEGRSLLLLGPVSERPGDATAAMSCAEQALSIFTAVGAPRGRRLPRTGRADRAKSPLDVTG
jgi:hypothetical protein